MESTTKRTALTAAAKPGLMQEVNEAQNHVRYARAAVALSLICTAVACGYGSYRLLSDLEAELGYSQYDYVASSFGPILDDSVDEKVFTLQSLGYHVETACASADTWPNCSIPIERFEYSTEKQMNIAGLQAVAFCPLLTSEQVDPFEQFAYDFYESEGEPSRGVHGFGKGIFTFDPSGSGEVIHDFDSSNAKGERDILVPLFLNHALTVNPAVVMFNLYSEPIRAATIDRAIDCAADGDSCLAVSAPLNLVRRSQTRPASLMISPLQNNGDTVAISLAIFYWDEIIKGAVPSSADQIHAVVYSAETDQAFTYVFERGELKYIGEGDRSSGDFPDLERTYSIDQFGEGLYSITISPTTEFMDDYQTYAPIVASIVSVCIILLTSLVFIAYDYFVKTQSQMHDNIMESKRMFVRYISHEIRTPLNTVHLGMKVLYEELCEILKLFENAPDVGAKVESLIDFVMDIDESNDSAVGVLNDLINYDKILVGSLSLESGQHDAIKLVTDTVRPFNVQAYKRKINFIIDADLKGSCSGGLSNDIPSLFIVGDDMKLKQVLRNVVSNALKFTDDGGTISVTVSWQPHGGIDALSTGSISIKVTDTGVGLSGQSLAVVGGEYVQINARNLQSGGGSGLGLWISKNIIELHHGTMVIDSDGLGCGTSVTITLPVYSGVPNENKHICTSPTLRNQNKTREKFPLSIAPPNDILASPNSNCIELTAPMRIEPDGTPDTPELSDLSKCIRLILVVDDVASTRKIVVRLLTRAGYECLEAVNGQDCLDVVAKHDNIDLVLMDYEMPVMNGPDATRAICKRSCPKLPVVGLTGNALPQDLAYFKDHGAVEVLVKPLNMEMLSTIIHQLNVDVR